MRKLKQDTKSIAQNQSGQTLVEFLLLLATITVIAFSFTNLLNANLAEQWTLMAQTILEDDTQRLQVR